MCERPNHKQEPLEYFCQDCQVCICVRCSATVHNQHVKLDIADAADQHKAEITQIIQKIREWALENSLKMGEEKESFKRFQQQVKSSRDEVQATMTELYRILKEYETSFMERLDDLLTQERQAHTAKQKNFELNLAQMTSSVEYMEAIVGRNIGAEILRSLTAISERSEEILQYEVKSSKVPNVNFVKNGELCDVLRQSPPGIFCESITDPSSSTAEGKGLHEAECGETAEFTVTTKAADGELCYSQQDRVSVHIQTAAGREVEADVRSNTDGRYRVTYTPMKHGESHVTIRLNGHVLPGSPWNVHVTPHQYQAISSFGSSGSGRGKLSIPWGVAVSNTGNVAVADVGNDKVIVFNSEGRYLNEFNSGSGAGQKLTGPTSVAYVDAEHILVGDDHTKVLLFKESGKFIKRFSPALLKNPKKVSVTRDGHVISCNLESKEVNVLSPDGSTLLQSFGAPSCDSDPWSAVQHEDKFFVSYPDSHCIKVFDTAGNYFRDIGRQGTGAGQLQRPQGVTIDKYDNLVVVDGGNKRLQIFTPEGELVSVVAVARSRALEEPRDVALSPDGRLYVIDGRKRCVHILR